MRRFFINKDNIKAETVFISGDEAHHIRDVVKLKEGERFLGFDGQGRTYTLRITRAAKDIEAYIEKISEKSLPKTRILLACAIPKKDKMNDIIEKATELGVSDIIPVITERTVVRVDKKDGPKKRERWERIALEACKQCGRDMAPCIHDVCGFRNAVELIGRLNYAKKLIPCLCEGSNYIADVLKKESLSVAVIIGPEGGFTKDEITWAKTSGFISVSLGELILKVDTACIFCLSILKDRPRHNAKN